MLLSHRLVAASRASHVSRSWGGGVCLCVCVHTVLLREATHAAKLHLSTALPGDRDVQQAAADVEDEITAAVNAQAPHTEDKWVASTQNLRGLGCSFVEKAWLARDDQKRSVTLAAHRQIHAGYACYDPPRNFHFAVVRSLCFELLKAAGLSLSSPKISEYIQIYHYVQSS